MTEPLLRSLEFERGITQQACKGITDPSGLIEHAENRARNLSHEYVQDHRWIQAGRNRRRDAREEFVDARNHLVWDTQTNIEDDERAYENLIVIRFAVLAYNRLRDT